MNLIIDIGNTFAKLAVFENDKIVNNKRFDLQDFIKEIKTTLEIYKQVEQCIVSSVGKLQETDVSFLKNKLHVLELNHNIQLPFHNLYKTFLCYQ